MIKPEQIPDEVVRRFSTWQFPKCSDKLMRGMLADAINAWPGMTENMEPGMYHELILPLTENHDDKV